jgi:hypothetical protein
MTIRMAPIDGRYNVLAVTNYTLFGFPKEIVFDTDEHWFVGPGNPDCDTVDLWGVAAHEIGHAWGFEHSHIRTSPQGELTTMFELAPISQQCPRPDLSHLWRNMSSDEEAGIGYMTARNWAPNYDFERATDCIDSSNCVADVYWAKTGTWIRNCTDPLPIAGCFMETAQVATLNAEKVPYR